MLGSIFAALLSPVIDPPRQGLVVELKEMHNTGKGGVLQCKSHRLVNLVAAPHGRQVFGIWSDPAKLNLSSYIDW